MKGVYELLGLIYRYGGFDAYKIWTAHETRSAGEKPALLVFIYLPGPFFVTRAALSICYRLVFAYHLISVSVTSPSPQVAVSSNLPFLAFSLPLFCISS